MAITFSRQNDTGSRASTTLVLKKSRFRSDTRLGPRQNVQLFMRRTKLSVNRSQQFPAPYKRLIDGIKQNYLRENDWRTDNLTNNRQLLTVTIDGSKRTNDITSLHSR